MSSRSARLPKASRSAISARSSPSRRSSTSVGRPSGCLCPSPRSAARSVHSNEALLDRARVVLTALDEAVATAQAVGGEMSARIMRLDVGVPAAWCSARVNHDVSVAWLNVVRIARARTSQSHPAHGRSTAPSGTRSRRPSRASVRRPNSRCSLSHEKRSAPLVRYDRRCPRMGEVRASFRSNASSQPPSVRLRACRSVSRSETTARSCVCVRQLLAVDSEVEIVAAVADQPSRRQACDEEHPGVVLRYPACLPPTPTSWRWAAEIDKA
jgi:hypothetical protein